MLEAVGRPHAVNPERALRRPAERRGWPVRSFSALPGAGLEPAAAGAITRMGRHRSIEIRNPTPAGLFLQPDQP
jgi:hypothetical protein